MFKSGPGVKSTGSGKSNADRVVRMP